MRARSLALLAGTMLPLALLSTASCTSPLIVAEERDSVDAGAEGSPLGPFNPATPGDSSVDATEEPTPLQDPAADASSE
jgi:hypothetical protein